MKASRLSPFWRLFVVQAASGVVGWSSRNRAFSAFGRSCNLTVGRTILLLPVVGRLAGGRLVLERHGERGRRLARRVHCGTVMETRVQTSELPLSDAPECESYRPLSYDGPRAAPIRHPNTRPVPCTGWTSGLRPNSYLGPNSTLGSASVSNASMSRSIDWFG
jgi:hypothetical protein